MANTLSREKQEAALRCLVDGPSVRATERVVGAHRDTVLRLMVRVGQGRGKVMDAEMRGLRTRRIEVDEVWGYVGKKQRHLTPADNPARSGDFWTFVAFGPESKLVPTFRLGKRDLYTATAFLQDLSKRLANRIHLLSDALRADEAIAWNRGS